MADRRRTRALVEERYGPPELGEDQVQLLAAVQAGLVHRHRRNAVTQLLAGDDWEHDGSTVLGGYRRATARLQPLFRRRLVALSVPLDADRPGEGAPDSWPWELTTEGEQALARAAPRHNRR